MLHRDNDAREWIRNQCIVCTHRNTQPIVIRQSRLDLRLGWLRSMQIDQERESNLESNLSLVKRESRWSKAINGWRGCFTVIWGRKTKPSKPYSCETMLCRHCLFLCAATRNRNPILDKTDEGPSWLFYLSTCDRQIRIHLSEPVAFAHTSDWLRDITFRVTNARAYHFF